MMKKLMSTMVVAVAVMTVAILSGTADAQMKKPETAQYSYSVMAT